MTEEKDETTDKQAELKEKLKDMGVMQDEHSAPVNKKSPLMQTKWLASFAVLVVGGVLWWYSASKQESTLADNSAPSAKPADAYLPPGYYGPAPYPAFEQPPFNYGNGPSSDSMPVPQSTAKLDIEKTTDSSEDLPVADQSNQFAPQTPPGYPSRYHPRNIGPHHFGPRYSGPRNFGSRNSGPRYSGPPPYYGQRYYRPPPPANWRPYNPPPRPAYYGPPPGYMLPY